jgi:hypothetical protein
MHFLFTERPGTCAAKFHHVCTNSRCKPYVMAEGTDVCTGIALNTEHDEASCFVEDLKFLYGTYPEDALDSALTRRALVKSSGELRTDLFHPYFVNITMQSHNADIFLIVLQEKRRKAHRIAKHDEKHSGYLRVKCAGMAHLAAEHLPYPRGNLMARRASWFIHHQNPGMLPQMQVFSRVSIYGHSLHFPV